MSNVFTITTPVLAEAVEMFRAGGSGKLDHVNAKVRNSAGRGMLDAVKRELEVRIATATNGNGNGAD